MQRCIIGGLLAVAIILSVFTCFRFFKAVSSDRNRGAIEIFDINKEAVVKRVQSNAKIQKEVERYLKGITGMYVKLNPIPGKGFMVKIPLEPPVRIENPLLSSLVDEVIIIFPEQGNSYLMVFDVQNRPQVFYFEGNTDILLKYLKFQPNSP